MNNYVIVKSFRGGLSVMLDPEIDFGILYTEVGKKFRESAKFFGNANMVISFEGRELDSEEERLLLGAICDNSELSVVCLIGHDEEKQQQYVTAASKFAGAMTETVSQGPMYYKGTVRASEVVESDTDLIILGDVNPGAEVKSTGNIIIFGTLYGTARAGVNEPSQAFIIALELRPERIQIGEAVTNVFERKSGLFKGKQLPKFVYQNDNEIKIEDISPDSIAKLPV